MESKQNILQGCSLKRTKQTNFQTPQHLDLDRGKELINQEQFLKKKRKKIQSKKAVLSNMTEEKISFSLHVGVKYV